MSTVFVGDVGTLIKLDTKNDVGEAIGVKILARVQGTDDVVELSAVVGETTKLQHVKTALTFAVAGIWELQAYVDFAGDEEYYGDFVLLPVMKELEIIVP